MLAMCSSASRLTNSWAALALTVPGATNVGAAKKTLRERSGGPVRQMSLPPKKSLVRQMSRARVRQMSHIPMANDFQSRVPRMPVAVRGLLRGALKRLV